MSNNESRKRFTGVAWFALGDWGEISDAVLDSQNLGDAYDSWRASAHDRINRLEEEGFTVQKIEIEPEEFTTWCRFRGQSPNTTAVRLYVAERIKPTEDARRVDGRRRPSQAAASDKPAPTAGGSAQLTARQRVAQLRPDLAALLPSPV